MSSQQLPPKRKRILFLTNSDRGEIGVFLATAQALLENPAFASEIELHFATFPGVENLVNTISSSATKAPTALPIVFHEIARPSFDDGITAWLAKRNVPHIPDYLPHSFLTPLPNFQATRQAVRDICPIIIPYDGPQLEAVVNNVLDILKEVGPDLCVVNSLMTPGLTAAVHVKVPFVVLSPNSIKDFSMGSQPRLAGLWKYPALMTGFPYPVPSYLIPLNILHVLHIAKTYLSEPHIRATQDYLRSETGMEVVAPGSLMANKIPGRKKGEPPLDIIVCSSRELDYPDLVVPGHVHPVGPVLGKWRALGEVDAEMEKWLTATGRKTIYINLGSIFKMAEEQALEMARALKIVLARAKEHDQGGGDAKKTGELQVLWKLQKFGTWEVSADPKMSRMADVLGPEIEAGIVKIDKWFKPEPISILKSGAVVCSVHHGGANSFNEAVVAGLPQIILPSWTDCYDYARRAELHGLGRWGSRNTKPQWNAKDLAEEMGYVLFGETGAKTRAKCKEMAELMASNGTGAAKAAEMVMIGLENGGKLVHSDESR